MSDNFDKATAIVNAIVCDITDRHGISDYWFDMDISQKVLIKASWHSQILSILQENEDDKC